MKPYRLLALFILGLTLVACGEKTAPTPTPLPTTSPVNRQLRVLDELWSAVNENYIYSDFGGADWNKLHADYELQIKGGLTNDEFETAMNSLIETLPEGSAQYFTRDERIQAELQNTTLYSGIGAYISVRAEPQPHIIILAVIDGSPAEGAGIKAHDSIYAIDDEPVTAEEGLDVVKRVRGESGALIILDVQSPGGQRRSVEVKRARLAAVDTLRGGLITEGNIFYMLAPVSTDETMLQLMTQGLSSVSQQTDIQGIILDLRVSHGGSWPLFEMLTLYGNGDLGEFYTRDDSQPVNVNGTNVGGSQSVPLVILVGPDTEGSPEIFAAAMQASRRATIVGLQTSGKILNFTEVPLPDGSRLAVATSSYKTSQGLDLSQFGVEPDIKIDADWDEVSSTSDPVIEKAVELLNK